MTTQPHPQRKPRRRPAGRVVKAVRPPRGPQDLARAMFTQADQKRRKG